MSPNQQTHKQHDTPLQQATAGAIIDAQGREIPITEQMIQSACRELDEKMKAENPPS
jgi:hypothetical protein